MAKHLSKSVVLVALGVSMGGAALAFEGAASSTADASITVLKEDLRPLTRHFNHAAKTTRFLAILSPT